MTEAEVRKEAQRLVKALESLDPLDRYAVLRKTAVWFNYEVKEKGRPGLNEAAE